VRGEMNQVAAIEEGNDLHALGQNVIVDLLDFSSIAFQHGIGVRALLQQH
jgi:hypothetical protein